MPRDKLNDLAKTYAFRTHEAVVDLVNAKDKKTLHDDHSAFPIEVLNHFKFFSSLAF